MEVRGLVHKLIIHLLFPYSNSISHLVFYVATYVNMEPEKIWFNLKTKANASMKYYPNSKHSQSCVYTFLEKVWLKTWA